MGVHKCMWIVVLCAVCLLQEASATSCVLPPIGPDDSTGCTGPTVLTDGQTCTATCDPGFTATSGSGTGRCTAGSFDPPTLVCSPNNCTLPPSGGTGVIGCTTAFGPLESGETCTVSCSPGFSGDAGSTLGSCTNGAFTPPTLICSPEPCVGGYTHPNAAGCDFVSLASGQTCQVTCNSGTTADAGSDLGSCNLGVFTSPSVVCTPNSPANFPVLDSITVLGTLFIYCLVHASALA